MMWNVFSYVYFFHPYIFFGELSLRSLAHFIIELFSYCWVLKSSLYILGRSPLLQVSFVKYFRPVFGWYSHSLDIFCSYFCVDHANSVISKNASLYPRSFRFSHLLLSKNIRILHLKILVCNPFWVNFCEESETE